MKQELKMGKDNSKDKGLALVKTNMKAYCKVT